MNTKLLTLSIIFILLGMACTNDNKPALDGKNKPSQNIDYESFEKSPSINSSSALPGHEYDFVTGTYKGDNPFHTNSIHLTPDGHSYICGMDESIVYDNLFDDANPYREEFSFFGELH